MSDEKLWNERYQTNEYLYSDRPNEFLKEFYANEKQKLEVLVPGDGDGRNGLWLASLGHEVTAFDYSAVAVEKANERAKKAGLQYKSYVLDVENWKPLEKYDSIAIIFLHLKKELSRQLFEKSILSLQKGGSLVAQLFSKEQLSFTSGGPKNTEMLAATDDFKFLERNFEDFQINQKLVNLNEGPLHTGPASVVNLIGKNLI